MKPIPAIHQCGIQDMKTRQSAMPTAPATTTQYLLHREERTGIASAAGTASRCPPATRSPISSVDTLSPASIYTLKNVRAALSPPTCNSETTDSSRMGPVGKACFLAIRLSADVRLASLVAITTKIAGADSAADRKSV